MPTTILSKTAEYDVATETEVAALIAEFEQATEALALAQAEADERWPAPRAFTAPEGKAHQAHLAPAQNALAAANKALSASRSLPVGTVVYFHTSGGWSGNNAAEGKITKITSSSYVVEKDYPSGTARLDREKAHEYMSSWGNTQGQRSLSVVRTPRQETAYQAQQAESRRAYAEERAQKEARWAAERRVQEAQAAQQGILREAAGKALERLIKAHQAEYDAMVLAALDVLASDAPGREESTLPTDTFASETA